MPNHQSMVSTLKYLPNQRLIVRLLIVIVSLLSQVVFGQTASFTTIPAAVNGTVTICEGQTITFTNTSTGTNQNTDYDWSFQNGSPNSPNGVGPHTITYNNNGNFNASLTLDNNSTFSVSVNVVNNNFNPNNPSLTSPSTSTLGYSTNTYDGLFYYRYCGTLIPYSSNIPFYFTLPTYPIGTIVEIDWGDNSTTTISNGSTSVNHTFPGASQNEFFVTLNYILPTGCTITQTFGVFLGLAPTIQLSGNGNSACIPNDYTFNLLTNNVPNTTYIVIFNDNSDPDTLIAPFNSLINHTFNSSSCGTTSVISGQGGSTISYANSFASSIIASNACGSTFSSIGPIYVSESVDANMSVSPSNTICLNDTLNVFNISDPGGNVSNTGCDTTNNYFWTIEPNLGFTILGGSIFGDGSSPFWPFWVTGSPELDIQFTTPGSYDIELVVANGCGIDSVTQTINVIQFPVVPPDTLTICTGNSFNYSPVNNPPTTIVPNGTTYTWTVSNNPNIIGESAGSGSSISGTLTNTTNTIQNVIYTVTPSVDGCDGPPFQLTVEVVPGLVFPNYTATVCDGGIFIVTPTNNPPTAIIPSGTTYTWTPVNNPNVQGEGPGSGPSITDTLSTNLISPAQSVIYNVTANSGATCPAQTFQVTVSINDVNPPVIAQDQTVCNPGNPLPFTSPTPAQGSGTLSYQWQSSTIPTGTFSTILNSNVPNYDPPAGLTTTTYYQVNTISTLNNLACSALSNTLQVSVNQVNAGTVGNSQTICAGGNPNPFNVVTAATGSGTLSYQWQSSTTNTAGSFSNITGAISPTYDPPAGIAATTYYQLVVTSTLNGVVCSATTSVLTVTVNTVNAGTIAANQTICNGGDPAPFTYTTPASGLGTLTYNWQSSTSSQTSGFTSITGANTATYNPPSGLTVNTFYQVIVNSSSSSVVCADTSNVVQVIINNVSPPIIESNQTICSGGDPTALGVQAVASGTGALTYQWFSSTNATTGFTAISGETATSYDPPAGLTTTTYYYLQVTSTLNGLPCSANSNVITVTVNSLSAGIFSANQTICSGGNPNAFTATTFPSGAGALTYQWQSSTISSTAGFSDIAGANTLEFDPPAGITTTTYYQLVVTSTLNGVVCTAVTPVLTITVNNISAAVIAADQTICSGGDPTTISATTAATGTNTPTYVWQSSTVSSTAGYTSIGGATSASYDPPAGLTSTTYYQVISTSTVNGVSCAATSNPITITVNNVSAGAISANQTICSGGDPLAFTNTIIPSGTGSLSYQWQSSTTNTTGSFSNIAGATSITFDPPAGVTLTTYYQLVVTSSLNGVSCSATTSPVTVTVNTISPGIIGSDQTICSGGNPAILSATTSATGSGTLSYVWSSSNVSNSTGFSPIGGATQASFDPPAGLTTTTYYQIEVSSTLNGVTCSASTNIVTVTINDITAPVIGSSQTICAGGNPNPFIAQTAANGSGNLTYQWQSSTTSLTAGFTNIGSATSATYDVPNGLNTTSYYQVITSSTLNGTVCQLPSNVLTVTINSVSAGTVAGNQTVCAGADPAAFTTVSGASGQGAISYQWQSSITSSTSGFGNITGATNATYDPPVGIQTTTYYQLVVTSTLNGIACSATTSPVTVNVNQIAASEIAANQTICSGGDPVAFTVTTSATGSATPTFIWQSSTTSPTTGFTTIPSAFGATYNPPSGLTVSTYYQVIATSTLNGIACSAVSNPILVTVIDNPVANAGPDVNVNCLNNSPGVTIGMGAIGGVSYSWSPSVGLSSASVSNPTASPSSTTTYTLTATDISFGCVSSDQVIVNVNLTVPIVEAGNNFNITCTTNPSGAGIGMTASTGVTYSWSPSNGLSSSTISNPNANPSATTIYTLTATNTASGCTATDQVTVTVNTAPPLANAGTDFTKTCVLNPNGAGIGDVAVSGVSYSWSPTTGLTSSTASNPTANPTQTTTYIVTATNTANGCTATDDVTVTVDNSFPTVNAGIDQVVCQGSSVTLTATGTDQYSWSNGVVNGVSFVPTSTTNYTVTGTDLTTGCVSTDVITVTVNPIPTANPLTNQVVCNSGSTNAIVFTGNVTNTVFNWTNSTTSIGLAASGQGPVASFIATNATNAPIVSTLTVQPTFTNLGVTCTGTSQNMTITVNPTPQVDPINNQGICVGSATTEVVFSSAFGVSGTAYTWTNTNSSIGIGSSGNGNIPSFTGTNNSNNPINGSFQVTPTFTNQNVTCNGAAQSFLITVNPTPSVVDPTDLVVCNNASVPLIVFSGSNANSLYTWTNNNTSINLPATGTSVITSFPATNLSNAPVTATISVTPSITNAGITCTGSSETFTITVNPTPSVDPLSSQAVCVGSPTSTVNFTSNLNVSGTVYSWTNTNTSIGLFSGGTGPIPSFTTTNTGNTPQTGTVTVTPSITLNSVTCTGSTQSMNIVVNPIPTVADPLDQVVCNGGLTQAVNFNGIVNGTIFNWTNSNPAINLLANGTGSIPSFVATNTTNSPISSTITVTPSYTNAGTTCTGTPQTFSITVNPTPTVDPISNQALCVGSTTNTVNFSSGFGVNSTVFNWTNSNPSIGLNANGTGNIGSFTTLNTSNSPATGTVIVTPSYENQNVTCNGTTQSFSIVVNPIPNVVDPIDQILCNGAQSAAVNFSGAVSGTVYNWTNTNTSINLGSNGTGNIPGFNALNASNTSISGAITVTPVFTNAGTTCTGSPNEFTITVLPTPTVDAISNQVECVGAATDAVSFTSGFGVTGTVFNWTNSNTAIGLGANGVGDIPSFTTTNTGNTMISGTIAVQPTISIGGTTCQGTTQNFSISVNPIPTVNDPLDQVVCNGAQTAAVNFTGTVTGTVYTWTSSNTAIGIGSGATGNILSFTALNTTNAPIQSIITVTPSYQFGGTTCTGSSQSFTITVNPTPTVDAFANQGLCVGETTNPISFTTAFGVNGTQFNWINSNSAIGLPSNGSGNIGSFTATNTTNNPITGTITVTPQITSGGVQCFGSTQTAVITVNPIPTVIDPLDQVICNGASSNAVTFNGAVNNTVFTWTNSITSIGLGSGANGNIPSFVAQNGGTTPVNSTITVTPSYTNATSTCVGSPQTMTITVNPTPTVIDPADVISCNGGTIADIIFQGTGTQYTWTNTVPSIGLSANGSGNINSFTAVNTTSNPVTATVSVQPQFLNAGLNCSGTIQSFLITVNPSPVVNFSVPNQTICSQTLSSGVTISSPTANADITWSIPNPPAGINGLTATNGTTTIPSMTLENTTSSPIVIQLFASATTPGSLACPGAGSLYTITVNPIPQLLDPVDQVICSGNSTAAVPFNGSGTSYSWTNSTTSIGLTSSGLGTVPSFVAQNGTSTVITSTVTVTPFFLNNSVNCPGPNQTFTFTVNPIPTVNAASDFTICNGELSNVVTFGGTGTAYEWTNNNPAIGLTANGTNVIPAFQGTNASANAITGTLTVTPIFENLNVSCQGPTDQVVITVNPSPLVDDPTDQVVCNSTSTSSVNFTGTGTSYTWINSNTGIGLGGNGTGNIPSFNALNSSTSPVSATITVTPQFTGTNLTCPGTPQTYTVTVNPTPSLDNPTDQVICNGQSTQLVSITGTGTSYSWVNNTPSIGLPATGSGNINPFVAINPNLTPLVASVVITPTFTGTLVSCDGQTQDVQFTINPTPTVVDPADQVVCNGSLTASVNFSGNGTSYTWTNSNPSIGLAASGTGNIASFTATNATSSPITATITVTPNFTGGVASCNGVNQTFTITVNPTPTVTDLPDQTICNGASTAPLDFIGSGTSYSWVNSNPTIGLNATGSGNITSFTGSNTGSNPISGTVTVTAQYTNANLTCNGQQQAIVLTINPTPTVITPANTAVCNGASTQTIILSGTGTSYTWTNSSPGIGLAANGTGNISSFVAVNTSNAPIVATITTTPIFTLNGETCFGQDQQFTLTVNPTPLVSDPIDQTVCNGSSTTAISFIGTGTSYSWTNTIPTIGLPSFGSGNIAAFTAVNTGSTAAQALIQVTPEYSNAGLVCSGTPQVFQIEVNPTPVVNDPLDVAYCNNSTVAAVNFTGTATNYSWTNSISSIGLAASGIGSILPFQGTNTTLNPLSSTVTVTPFFTNPNIVCPGQPQSFTITINPTPMVNDPLDQVVCNQFATNSVSFAGSATSYNWTNSLPSIGLQGTGNGNILAFNALNGGSTAVNALITVTPQFTGSGITCLGNAETFTITVNPSPQVTAIPPITICNNSDFTVNLSSNIPSNFTWSANPSANITGEVTLPQSSSTVSNTLSNTTTSPQTVTYVVSPISAPQGCPGPDSTFTVTVIPDVILAIPQTIEICSGASVNAVLAANVPSSYSWFTTLDNPNVTGESITPSTGSLINDILVNNSTTNQLVIYSVTPTSVNGNCIGAAQTIAVTVKPPLALLNEDSITICSGSSVGLNLVANTSVSFNWFAFPSVNVQGESISTVSSSVISDVLTNSTSIPQEVLYNVVGTSTANGCSSPIFPIYVTVNPIPTMNPVLNVTVCNGSTTTPINFTSNNPNVQFEWVNPNPSIGLATNGTGNIPSFIATNAGTTITNTTITVRPVFTFNGVTCFGANQSFTLTINPTPGIFPIQNQVICAGSTSSLVNISGPVSSTVYNWVNNNPTIGLVANGSNSIPVFSGQNSTFTINTGQVTITPTFTNNSETCPGTPLNVTYTINPTPDVIPVTNQVVCNGSPTAPIAFGSNVAGTQFSWTNSTPTIGLASNGNGNISSFNGLNNANNPLTGLISVTPSYVTNNLVCTGPVSTFSVQVNPIPTVDPMPTLTYCHNTVSVVDFNSTFMNNNPAVTYNWVNSNTAVGIPAVGTGDINFLATNTSNVPISTQLIVTPVYISNGVSCNGPSQSVSITINPTPTVDPVFNQTVCGSTQVVVDFTSSLNAFNTNFNWTNSTTSIGLAATGSGDISFNAVNATNGPLTSNVTVTPVYTNQGTTCTGTPTNFSITVNPIPVVNPIQNQVICANTNSLPVNFSSNVSNTTFSWTNTNGSIGIGTNGQGNIPAFVGLNSSTTVNSGNFQVAASYTNNAVTCTGSNQLFTIAVNPSPVVDNVSDITLCASGLSSQIVFSGNTPGATYQWTNNNTSIGLAASGTGSIPPFTAVNNTTAISTATVTVTPSFTFNGSTCTGTPEVFTISVNPIPTVSAVANSIYCNNATTNNILFNGSISGTQFTWTNNNIAIGLPAIGSGTISPFVATNSGIVPITGNLTVVPVVNFNGTSCSGNPQPFTITVNPTPNVVVPVDQVVCGGSATNNVAFTGNIPNTIYTWTNSNTLTGLATNGQGNINSFITPSTLINPEVSTITITPSYSNNITCTGASQIFTITVNPTPITNDPIDQVLCNGSSTQAVNFTSSVNNSSYSWTNTNTTIGLGTSGNGPIPSFIAVNGTNIPQVATITVTSSFTNAGVTCTGTTQTFTITVNPTPSVNDPLDLTLCNNAQTNPINFTGNVAGTVYNWTNSLPNIGLTTTGTGNIAPFVATNPSTTTVIADLSVTPTFTNLGVTCTGTPQNFTITVHPTANLTSGGTEICSNENVGLTLTSNIPSIISWQGTNNVNVTGETLVPQASNLINDLLINPTNNAQIVSYTIALITSDFGCPSGPFTIPVVVNALPDVQFAPINAPFCDLDPIQFQNTTPGTNTYTWNFGDGSTSTDQNPTNVYGAFGTYNVTLTATNTVTGCVDSLIQPVTILESPAVGFTASATEGCVLFETVFTDVINAPNTTLTWDFGDGATSNQPFAIDHQYDEAGCYDVTLTVTNAAGCSSSLTQVDFVCAYDIPLADFIVSPDSALVSEPLFEFTNQSIDAFTYLWDFGDGSSSLSTNPIHEYDDVPESYVVTLFAYNEFGCYDSTLLTVTVYEDLIFYVPNSFTPNGDGTNDVFLPVITSGVDLGNYQLLIFNRWGQVVFSTTDPTMGWDGTYMNLQEFLTGEDNFAQDGTYTWKIILNSSQNEGAVEKVGHVTLLR